MNVHSVPSKNPATGEAVSRDAVTGHAVQGLIATFSDMLRNAGLRMEGEAGKLMTKADTQGTREAGPADRPAPSRSERRSDAQAAPAEKPRRARGGDERTSKSEMKPSEPSPASQKADRAKTPASPTTETEATASAPATSSDDAKDTGAAERSTAAVPQTDGETASAAVPGEDAVVAAIPLPEATATAPDATSSGPAETVASVLATQILAQPATPAEDPALTAGDAVAAVGDTQAAAGGTAGTDARSADADLAAVLAASGSAAKVAPAAPAPRAPTPGNAIPPDDGAQADGDAAFNPADLKIQQAAALSRLTGTGNVVAVRTTVTDPSAQLISQPAATLSAPTVAAAAESANSAAAAWVPTAPGANGNAAAQMAQATADASPLVLQNQQAESQMVRAQGASLAGDAARTAVQAAGAAGSAGLQTSTGGGEGLAGGGAQAALHTAAPSHAPQSQAAAQPRFTVPQQAAVDQVSVQISKAIKDGVDRIHIQLRPEQMGRVDVRLEVTDGRVSATVTADTKETLDMLQRDARELERALQQAGLQTDTGSLNFSLRGQQGQGEANSRQLTGGPAGQAAPTAEETAAETPAWIDYPGGIRPDGRVDIRA